MIHANVPRRWQYAFAELDAAIHTPAADLGHGEADLIEVVEHLLVSRASQANDAQAALSAVWPELDKDPDVKADVIVIRELRKVPLEEICRVDLDLSRIERRRLTTAVARATELRERASR